MFSVRTNHQLDLCLRKTESVNYKINVLSSFSKSFAFNMFVHAPNEKPAFSNSSGLKSSFGKLRFRDGLVWTVGLTGEIKLHFEMSPA